MKKIIILLLLGLSWQPCVAAQSENTINVEQIVTKANHMALYQGADSKGHVHMTITGKNGITRVREFSILRRNIGNQDRDQMYYTLFKRPADVRKMAFMVHKHAALTKDDDRWLYLPGLDLVKRIAASDKRTSFVGSDFLYEDISGRSPDDDIHELLETTQAHYVIKNTPKHPHSVEFVYYIAYIDKHNFMPMKMEFFKPQDRLYRRIDVAQVDGVHAEFDGHSIVYPTVTVSVAKDLENGSTTKMVFSNIAYNQGVSPRIFSERYLRRPPREAM
nr:outer membrane lipoprotein-sorting protein [uncultured Desulfobacter sp.]